MERTKKSKPLSVQMKPLSVQMKHKVENPAKKKEEYDGDFGTVISTGSTLLDLEISGRRIHGGGLPGGILVEIFGPSSSGKTVLLTEIGGAVQRANGATMFHDPEARLNPLFAALFGLSIKDIAYKTPDTVTEVFKAVREWEPSNIKIVNGIFADSLAALSTDLEMENKEGDKMGMRRAKEFSEELRKTCRILKQRNFLMVCSNQVRQNMDAGPYGPRFTSPGGEAIGFYSSLRLRTFKPEKIRTRQLIAGKEVKRVIGVDVQVEVFKSSISNPYGIAPVTIIFDYGIDDIRQNLQYIKTYNKYTTYTLGGENIGRSMEESIDHIEKNKLESVLREEVINLWEEIEAKFETNRKPRRS